MSVDSTPTLEEFKRQLGLQTDFLSDFKRDVARRYGVLLEERFFANRAYFLIDRAGVVQWARVEQNPSFKRSNGELLARIGSAA